jgi:hypothetical protein
MPSTSKKEVQHITDKGIAEMDNSVVAGSNKLWPYQMLERSAAKAACCVLMGASFR